MKLFIVIGMLFPIQCISQIKMVYLYEDVVDSFLYESKTYFDTVNTRNPLNESGIFLTKDVYFDSTLKSRSRFYTDKETLKSSENYLNNSQVSLKYFDTGTLESITTVLDAEGIHSIQWYMNGKLKNEENNNGFMLKTSSYYASGNIASYFYLDKKKNKKNVNESYYNISHSLMSKEYYKPIQYFSGDSSDFKLLKIEYRLKGYYPVGPDIFYNEDGSIKEKYYYQHGIVRKIIIYSGKIKTIKSFDSNGKEILN